MIKNLLILVLLLPTIELTRNDDNRFSQVDPLIKKWIEGLKDKKGQGCCDTADGYPANVDYDVRTGKYWVYIVNGWYEVPEDAILTQPNKLGRAMVWWYPGYDMNNNLLPKIRCFIPGSGASLVDKLFTIG